MFVLFAPFVIRQTACRDTGFSPHQVVYGRNLWGHLDLLYAGWVEEQLEKVDVCEWVSRLVDRLNIVHDFVVSKRKDVSTHRKEMHDKG